MPIPDPVPHSRPRYQASSPPWTPRSQSMDLGTFAPRDDHFSSPIPKEYVEAKSRSASTSATSSPRGSMSSPRSSSSKIGRVDARGALGSSTMMSRSESDGLRDGSSKSSREAVVGLGLGSPPTAYSARESRSASEQGSASPRGPSNSSVPSPSMIPRPRGLSGPSSQPRLPPRNMPAQGPTSSFITKTYSSPPADRSPTQQPYMSMRNISQSGPTENQGRPDRLMARQRYSSSPLSSSARNEPTIDLSRPAQPSTRHASPKPESSKFGSQSNPHPISAISSGSRRTSYHLGTSTPASSSSHFHTSDSGHGYFDSHQPRESEHSQMGSSEEVLDSIDLTSERSASPEPQQPASTESTPQIKQAGHRHPSVSSIAENGTQAFFRSRHGSMDSRYSSRPARPVPVPILIPERRSSANSAGSVPHISPRTSSIQVFPPSPSADADPSRAREASKALQALGFVAATDGIPSDPFIPDSPELSGVREEIREIYAHRDLPESPKTKRLPRPSPRNSPRPDRKSPNLSIQPPAIEAVFRPSSARPSPPVPAKNPLRSISQQSLNGAVRVRSPPASSSLDPAVGAAPPSRDDAAGQIPISQELASTTSNLPQSLNAGNRRLDLQVDETAVDFGRLSMMSMPSIYSEPATPVTDTTPRMREETVMFPASEGLLGIEISEEDVTGESASLLDTGLTVDSEVWLKMGTNAYGCSMRPYPRARVERTMAGQISRRRIPMMHRRNT